MKTFECKHCGSDITVTNYGSQTSVECPGCDTQYRVDYDAEPNKDLTQLIEVK